MRVDALGADIGGSGSFGMRLWESGWSFIPVEGKLPVWDGRQRLRWKPYQDRPPTENEVLDWVKGFPNAGVALVLQRGQIAFDFDEDDPDSAAGLGEIADEIFGPSPIQRVGRWPRHVRLYQGQRITSQNIGALQVLTRGKYVVMSGIHPDTGEPYKRYGQELYDLRAADLPTITRKQIAAFRAATLGLGTPHTSVRRTSTHVGATGLTLAAAMEGIAKGHRRDAIFCIASACRGAGLPIETARAFAREANARCKPPRPVNAVMDLVTWCYDTFPPGTSQQTGRLDIAGVPKVLCVALEHAKNAPVIHHGPKRYRLLTGIAHDLQRYLPDQPIALPQKALGRALRCSHNLVGKMIQRARRENLLVSADDDYQIGVLAKKYWWKGPTHLVPLSKQEVSTRE